MKLAFINILVRKIIPALSFILLITGSACKKEKQGVPLVAVDIRLYSTDPSFMPINAVGGWTYVNGGYRGILIYRKTLNDFMAYDRACTYNPSDENELIKVDASNVLATDAHCGSKFLITDGTVNQGPATLPLKSYVTTFDGTLLHITN
ncbi:MAG: hypothetical protein ACHQRM_15190 [Bacteroidia bacterium]